MKRKISKFLAGNQLMLLLLLSGVAFMTLTEGWSRYGEPYLQFFDGCRNFGHADAAKDKNQEVVKERNTGWFGFAVQNEANSVKEEITENVEEGKKEETDQQAAEGDAEGIRENELPKEVVWHEVEDSYFDDALFIGDSRVVGLQDYGQLQDHATFYASTGLNIFRLLKARIATIEGQLKKVSVEEALGQRQFGKIYLMVGINELDIGTVEHFEETYKETIDRIRELQPGAIIYIQSIMKVTTKRAAKGDFVKNEGIVARNDAIMKLADNENIFYLDVNEAVCDESGGMNPTYTSDGIHLKVKYIPLWRDYLKCHAIIKE